MTRKDYIALANAISVARLQATTLQKDREISAVESACMHVAHRMADHFAADNPRFDRARFLQACGVTP